MNDNLIERAEKLLDGITPGPWLVECDDNEWDRDSGYAVWSDDGLPVRAYIAEHTPQGRKDAEFIAAAPEITRSLLAEVKRLREWKSEAGPVMDGLQELGQALGLPLGSHITGPEATAKAKSLAAEVKYLEDLVAAWKEDAIECNLELRSIARLVGVPSDGVLDVPLLLTEVKRLTPRVIETMKELRALPEGTVVREGGDVPFIYESYWDARWGELRWLYPGDDDPQRNIELPVTVLYQPGER